MARIESQDMTVVETVGQVDMKFMITGGDDLARSRAFAVTRNLSAMAGIFITCIHVVRFGDFFTESIIVTVHARDCI